MAGKAGAQQVNVLGKSLALFSKEPMTGFYRNGYCQVGADDVGNHSIAATLTNTFLDFTQSRGNNLRSIGLKEGCKWCLCAERWKEALLFERSEEGKGRGVVPKVDLEATNMKALDSVKLEDLKEFAIDGKGRGDEKEL